jgi:hypothetical protein
MWLMFIHPNQLEISTLFDYLSNSGIKVQYPLLMIGAFIPRSPAGDVRGSYFIQNRQRRNPKPIITKSLHG